MRCSALVLLLAFLIIAPLSALGTTGSVFGPDTNRILVGTDQLIVGSDPSNSGGSTLLANMLIENAGQLDDDDILFYTKGDPAVAFYSDGYLISDLGRNSDQISSVKVDFMGSSAASIKGTEKMEATLNFIIGENVIQDVTTYNGLIYENLYPDIDLVFTLSGEDMKYDLIVKPGSDPDKIKMRYIGAEIIGSDDGRILSFGCGNLLVSDGPLLSLQDEMEIYSEYIVIGDIVTISVGEYDRDQDLIIDPLMKSSTYLGGSDWERDVKVEIDPWDNLIACGITDSTDFPTTPGVISRTKSMDTDLFTARFSSDLSSLYCATYLGGDGYEYLRGLDIDDNGDIYMTGTTTSPDYPRTSGAYQTAFGGGKDGFVTKISSNCKNLLFSTLLGGSGDDELRDISVDSSGSSFITGYTRSADFVNTSGAYQKILAGTQNGFITKLSSAGDSVQYSTYIGGSDLDYAFCIELMGGTDPVIAGQTISSNYPTTPGAFDRNYGGYSGFVTGFTSDLSGLSFSTLFSNATWIYDLEIGSDNGLFITGRTQDIKGKFHISNDAFDDRFEGGEEGFVSKLSHNGSQLLYSSYLGKTENADGIPHFTYEERCTDLEVSPEGRAFIVGHTDAPNLYVTKGAFDKSRSERDGMFAVVSPDGTTLEYCTYLGGNDEDSITDIALNSSSYLYLGGYTYYNYINHDFPVTSSAYDTTFNGGYDAFITSFKGDSFIPDILQAVAIQTGDSYANLSWEPPLFNGYEDITGYNVHQGFTSNPSNTHSIASGLTSLHLNVTGLENGYRYFFFIGAVNVVGEGDLASVNGTPLSAPSAPYSPKAAAGDEHINVTWTGVYDGGAPPVTFNIYIGTNETNMELLASGLKDRWYDIRGIQNGIEYWIRVSGTNVVGEGPGSKILKATPRGLPSEPKNLRVVSIGSGYANLTWNQPEDTGGAGNLSYTLLNALNETYWATMTTGINETGINITSLRNGNTYRFKIAALNEVGYGPDSNNITVIPMGNFSPPAEFRGWAVNDTIHLSWKRPLSTGGAPIFTYNVYMSEDNITFELYREEVTRTSISIGGFDKGSDFFFVVSAHNGRWEGDLTDPVMVIPRTVPSVPLNVSITSGDLWINITWDDPIDHGGDPDLRYEVYWGDDPEYPEITTGIGRPYVNLSDFDKGIEYYFWISAVNMMGSGNRTDRISITVYTSPSIPINPEYSDGNRFIEIEWRPSSDKGGYESVLYRVYLGLSTDEMDLVGDDLEDRSFMIEGLTNGIEYFIGITAFNPSGEGPMTQVLSATPMVLSTKPLNINITAGDGFVNLQWEYPEDDGGSEIWMFHIFRNDSNGNFQRIKMIDSSARSYTDLGVSDGVEYSYRIRAENDVGIGDWSEVFKATPESEVEERSDYGLYIIAAGVVLGILLALVSIFIIAETGRRKRKKDDRMWAASREEGDRRRAARPNPEE